MRRLLLLALCALPLVAAADAGPGDPGPQDTGRDVAGHWVSAGGTVEISQPQKGSAYLVGEFMSVKAPVAGSVYAVGAHLEVGEAIGKGLYAVAESIRIGGSVHGHANLVGETVETRPEARLEGPASIVARSATLAGELPGGLKVAARSVRIEGHVAGDLEVTGEHVELGPAARVDGRLSYRGEHAPEIADGAVVSGGTEHLASGYGHFGWWNREHHFGPVGHAPGSLTGFIVGVVMLLLGPAFMAEASTIWRREWAQSMGIGLMVLIGVPFACVLLVLTLIGIPVALLAIALYAALLMLGYACGAIALGDFGLATFAPTRASGTGARVLALAAALLALALVRHVVLLGGLAVFLVFLGGIGALVQRALRKAPPASAA